MVEHITVAAPYNKWRHKFTIYAPVQSQTLNLSLVRAVLVVRLLAAGQARERRRGVVGLYAEHDVAVAGELRCVAGIQAAVSAEACGA